VFPWQKPLNIKKYLRENLMNLLHSYLIIAAERPYVKMKEKTLRQTGRK
jgi:hypothetical protein